MTTVVLAGTDEDGLGEELADRDVDLRRVDVANRPALEEAGLAEADVYALTEAEQATSIVVARELNSDVRIVAYTDDSLPEFVSGQEVLAMDPGLMDPETFVDELLGEQ